MLCYRGGEQILSYIRQIEEQLASARLRFQIVLVANYDSTDDPTPEVVSRLCKTAKHFVPVIRKKEGKMGWDLKTGLDAATGECLAFIDGDGQTIPSDIMRLYSLLRNEGLDFCKIYRETRGDSLLRRIISVLFNSLFRLMFPSVRVKDINAKPKLITRTAYHQMVLTSDDWFIDAEIVLEAHRLALRFKEIPGDALANSWRKSFIGISAVCEFLKNLLRYRTRY